jgi:hypothetical protein
LRLSGQYAIINLQLPSLPFTFPVFGPSSFRRLFFLPENGRRAEKEIFCRKEERQIPAGIFVQKEKNKNFEN